MEISNFKFQNSTIKGRWRCGCASILVHQLQFVFAKKDMLYARFSKKNNFNLIADLGCNDGEYSALCLRSDCKKVIGFDFDINAIDQAYKNASKENLDFLPLYFDAANPSSNLGWYQNERKGFIERANFNAIIALAFEHHLAIGKNIPLNDVVAIG